MCHRLCHKGLRNSGAKIDTKIRLLTYVCLHPHQGRQENASHNRMRADKYICAHLKYTCSPLMTSREVNDQISAPIKAFPSYVLIYTQVSFFSPCLSENLQYLHPLFLLILVSLLFYFIFSPFHSKPHPWTHLVQKATDSNVNVPSRQRHPH